MASLWNICVGATMLKLLLVPAYHSTDMDVHRNWLALTAALPLKDWYTESTSVWTLDYPPLFAYFEWVLSRFVPPAVAQDGCMAITERDGQYGFPTVLFLRCTVIVSDFLLFYALQWYVSASQSISERKRNIVVACSIILSPGLLIIDHIHFQYNGFLFGIFILSLVNAKLGNYLQCALWFSVLLCFKHIFLYVSPAYFVFLFSVYCVDRTVQDEKTEARWLAKLVRLIKWKNLAKLGCVVLSVFALAFAPFVYYGRMPQLLARLFPFSRGLTHAYWAPNIWAVYSLVDRVLIKLVKFLPRFVSAKLFPEVSHVDVNSLTRGIVGDVQFAYLPQVTPRQTFILTLFYQVMACIPLLIQPTFERFIGCLTLCGWSSFLFGWHVHEKAILLIIIPMSFVVCHDRRLLAPFQLVTLSGYVSLFPLLYESNDWIFKCTFMLIWFIIFSSSLSQVVHFARRIEMRVVEWDRLNLVYMMFIPMMVVGVKIWELNHSKVEGDIFGPLMVYSIVCCFGVISGWASFSWLYFLDDEIWSSPNSIGSQTR